jgi:hypothetical protein
MYQRTIARIICTFLFAFSFSSLKAQDTFNVFFDFGLAYLKAESRAAIDNIPFLHKTSEIDSIWFVGMADTTGPTFINKILAKKRAKNCAQYFDKRNERDSIPYRVFSKGEMNDDHFGTSRRVSIIVHLKPKIDSIVEKKRDTICYYLAYQILYNSIEKIIGKGENKKVRLSIESLPKSDFERSQIYYYGWFDTLGVFQKKEVYFKMKITGKLWWRKRRYTADIPFESYRLHKIFTIGKEPCGRCTEGFIANEQVRPDTFLVADDHIMKYLQYRRLPWQRRKIDYRIPVDFIEQNTQYYLGCDTSKKVNWTKNDSAVGSKSFYAYTTAKTFENNIPTVTRFKPSCTPIYRCDSFRCFLCGTRCSHDKKEITFFAEFGHLGNELLTDYYLGAGFSFSKKKFEHRISVNQSFSEIPFFKYNLRYTVFEKYKKYVKPTLSWTSTSVSRSSHYNTRLFVGAQLILFSENDDIIYDPYLTIGLEFWNYKRLKTFGQIGVINAVIYPNERKRFFDYGNVGINYVLFR